MLGYYLVRGLLLFSQESLSKTYGCNLVQRKAIVLLLFVEAVRTVFVVLMSLDFPWRWLFF